MSVFLRQIQVSTRLNAATYRRHVDSILSLWHHLPDPAWAPPDPRDLWEAIFTSALDAVASTTQNYPLDWPSRSAGARAAIVKNHDWLIVHARRVRRRLTTLTEGSHRYNVGEFTRRTLEAHARTLRALILPPLRPVQRRDGRLQIQRPIP